MDKNPEEITKEFTKLDELENFLSTSERYAKLGTPEAGHPFSHRIVPRREVTAVATTQDASEDGGGLYTSVFPVEWLPERLEVVEADKFQVRVIFNGTNREAILTRAVGMHDMPESLERLDNYAKPLQGDELEAKIRDLVANLPAGTTHVKEFLEFRPIIKDYIGRFVAYACITAEVRIPEASLLKVS
jgi:hypothetical protein